MDFRICLAHTLNDISDTTTPMRRHGNDTGIKGGDKKLHPTHDDVIKWKHCPRYWPFVRGIHLSPVNSPHGGQWRRSLMFSLIYAWTNGRVNNREAGDFKRHRAHCDVTVMSICAHTTDVFMLLFSIDFERLGCDHDDISAGQSCLLGRGRKMMKYP